MTEVSFQIGSIPVHGRLILAPMDGYSDLPFRVMVRNLGSAISYTEFINCVDVVGGGTHSKLLQRIAYLPSERPVAFQILDNDPARILAAALKLQGYQPDFFDVNMGCSANSVVHRGAGAGLLKEPQKIGEIIHLLTTHLSIPITAKIRIGWDDSSRNFLDVARIIEDNGASALAVHGRTRSQLYNGVSDWDAIAQIKEALAIPVIGNGDVRTTSDIHKIIEHTHCDAVMIGRAAITNPWIFSCKDRYEVSKPEALNFINQLLVEMVQFYGEPLGVIRSRKFIKLLLHPLGCPKDLILELMHPSSILEVSKILNRLE